MSYLVIYGDDDDGYETRIELGENIRETVREVVKPFPYSSCQYCKALISEGGLEQHNIWHLSLAMLITCPTCKSVGGKACRHNGLPTFLHDSRVMLRYIDNSQDIR
jgi:hypothetical protein